MKFKCLAALIACTVMQSAIFGPVYAQDASKINKWFEDIDKKYPNLRKKQNVGNIQDPGKIGTPGKFQNPGNINAPQGLQAIKTKSDPCSQRFSIGADTLFEFDKATLTPRAEETLSVLGPMIENAGLHPVLIEGHTDSVGTDEYNQELSERRAERVRNWLLEHRVVEKRAVSTVGYGEKKPVAPNTKPDGKDNPPGRALNRRVEVVVNTCAKLDEPAVSTSPVPSAETATTSAETSAQSGASAATETPATKEAAAESNSNLPAEGAASGSDKPAGSAVPDANMPLPGKP